LVERITARDREGKKRQKRGGGREREREIEERRIS
jgi:hypothetical protein